MNLQHFLKEIKKILLQNYKKDLAAILVFGSANTGEWKEGKSDIDLIILFRDDCKLNLLQEKNKIFGELKRFNPSIVHFTKLKEAKKHIYQEGSWSSWITAISGSRKLYSTPESEKIRKYFIMHPPLKKKLLRYVKQKDKFELDGYLKKSMGFAKTKGIFSHIRRKLQILNYYQNKKIEFDYNKCLSKIYFEKNLKEELKILYQYYKNKRALNKVDYTKYYSIAKNLTKIIQSN